MQRMQNAQMATVQMSIHDDMLFLLCRSILWLVPQLNWCLSPSLHVARTCPCLYAGISNVSLMHCRVMETYDLPPGMTVSPPDRVSVVFSPKLTLRTKTTDIESINRLERWGGRVEEGGGMGKLQ
jgi:hypothetical protein